MKKNKTWIALGLALCVTLFLTGGAFAQQTQAPTPPSTPGQVSPPAIPKPDIKKPEMPKRPEMSRPSSSSEPSPQIKALEERVRALENRVKALEGKAK